MNDAVCRHDRAIEHGAKSVLGVRSSLAFYRERVVVLENLMGRVRGSFDGQPMTIQGKGWLLFLDGQHTESVGCELEMRTCHELMLAHDLHRKLLENVRSQNMLATSTGSNNSSC